MFLIRSYGAPNGAGRCSVAQCYDNTWAMLKLNWANIANGNTIGFYSTRKCILILTLYIVTSCMVQLNLLAQL